MPRRGTPRNDTKRASFSYELAAQARNDIKSGKA